MVNRIIKNKEKLYWWGFLIFVASIPFSQTLSSTLLIIVFLASFFFRTSSGYFSRLFLQAWDICLYLVVLLIGLIYTADLATGYKEIETSLSIFILPFMVMRIPELNAARLRKIFYAFAAGLALACIIFLAHATVFYMRGEDTRSFFSDQLTEVIPNFHPTYLAYYLIFTISFGLNLMYYEKATVKPVVIVPMSFFFFAMLMLTAGQTAFISLLLILSFFVLKFFTEPDRSKNKILTFSVVCCLLIGLFAVNINAKRQPYEDGESDAWDRLTLWESGISATPDVLWGTGTGDYKRDLNAYYKKHNLKALADTSINSHNQFIQIFFSNGLFGVLSLIFLLARPLYISERKQNLFGILTFFPFIIYGMTEVFLGRYQGVVFFALLHQCFIAHYQSQKPPLSLK